MVLSEEILRLLSEFSFDKSLKLFYYYFKYYMCHLNLYNPQEHTIKDLYHPADTFIFTYFHDTLTTVNIKALRKTLQDRGISNFYQAACMINK